MADYTHKNLSDVEDAAVKRLNVTRGFEAGDDGLELLVFSRSVPGDAEIVEWFFDE